MKGVCRTCGATEDLTKDGNECKPCNRGRQKGYRIAKGSVPYSDRPMVCRVCGTDTNLSIINGKSVRLCLSCAAKKQRDQRSKPHSKHLEQHRQYRQKLRKEILDAYGSVCKVCGQTNQIYLQIDHINGNGNKHRAEVGTEGVYNDIKRQGYPQDKYQVLCANCHLAKTRGYDPYAIINE